MEYHYDSKLNGRDVILPANLNTFQKISDFLLTNSKNEISLILADKVEIQTRKKSNTTLNLKIECFTKIYQSKMNNFIYHYYRKHIVYYRCKCCWRSAMFCGGKFIEKHSQKCRLKKSKVTIKDNFEKKTSDAASKLTRSTIDLNYSEQESLNCSNREIYYTENKCKELTILNYVAFNSEVNQNVENTVYGVNQDEVNNYLEAVKPCDNWKKIGLEIKLEDNKDNDDCRPAESEIYILYFL
jgi:hypothetical protein